MLNLSIIDEMYEFMIYEFIFIRRVRWWGGGGGGGGRYKFYIGV